MKQSIELAQRWSDWSLERNRRGTRIALWVVATLYPAFSALDYLLAPRAALPVFWSTRIIVTLTTFAMFAVVRSRLFESFPEIVSSAYMVFIACGISLMTTYLGGLASPYYAGLSLVIVGTGLVFVWPARVVVITHASIVVLFVLINLFVSPPARLAEPISNLAFLTATAIITATGQIVLYRLQQDQTVGQVALEQAKANLELAHEELKQLDHFKSEFFANITHELKTPLAMLLSPLEMLAHGDLGQPSPTQKSMFEAMFRNGLKLLKLIDDLLDLSKLEESRLRLKIGEHDLVAYLGALVEQVQPLAERKRIELRFDTNAASSLCHCDLERMERVFINLLSNAVKFTPEAGHVAVRLQDAGKTVSIVVEDDGPGFPPAKVEQLFERFFQVDMGETRKYGGTGIGLALAKEIVELHGGSIRAESNRGAKFTVQLVKDRGHFRPEVLDRRGHRRDVPSGSRANDRGLMDFAAQMAARDEFRLLDIAEVTERRLIERDPEEDQRPYTALVVEDMPDVIRLVHLALRPDFKVLSAADGLQGLEMATRELPTLIITDLMMPGIDGLELTRRLKADSRTQHIPVLMLTARGDLDDRVSGMETGVNVYLAKPFSPRELLSAARSLVKAQSTTAELVLTHRLDSLEIVTGGLAHEINNPLNYLKNALARVRMDAEQLLELSLQRGGSPQIPKLEARIREMLEIADSGIRRIAKTVELMTNYSRAGYSRELRTHDAFAAMRDVIALVAPANDRRVRIETSFAGEGTIECVPEEFNQVLTNLLQNAIEAAPADGSGLVRVRGSTENGSVGLSIKDNGSGIRAEDRARVFTPFFTTKGPGKGMGLGLTIAWRVVQSLGGKIEISSPPGEGAEFTVRVPSRQASSARGARGAA